MAKYALFDADGTQVTKAHSTKDAVAVEAYEAGLVYYTSKHGNVFWHGHEVMEVEAS